MSLNRDSTVHSCSDVYFLISQKSKMVTIITCQISLCPFNYVNLSARSRENFKTFKVQVFTLTLLQFDEIYYLIPGFNVETVEYKNISFTVWDVGGQDKIRYESFINHLFQNRLLTLICFILLLRCRQGQGQLLDIYSYA